MYNVVQAEERLQTQEMELRQVLDFTPQPSDRALSVDRVGRVDTLLSRRPKAVPAEIAQLLLQKG
jgi:hypothetical protein